MASQQTSFARIGEAIARDGNTPWYAALTQSDGSTVFADTITELVQHLIPGYAPDASTAEGARDALDVRYNFSVEEAAIIQAGVIAAASGLGIFSAATTSEDDLGILFSPKDATPTGFAEWKLNVPLVLISTDYAPFTDIQAPTGQVQFIDPSTDLTLIKSMSAFGNFELLLNENAA